ncbi:high choriolytic enzyme 1-like [Denticeps clupeoides]|uniref:Metalloendopeptidase n=1 Tax=Denticeps clupeoides TaxID=299321 RepID=A0AAY4EAH4_9TELE|nr:high choriolytic enzyme 1-like [Denticeps clupeoides]XP_028813169.1 high choriolytic enzyme 1-like [Denticeps clupeoides]XP_028813179.1 high choriolytic enzyme 1-like isoform X1 [Denticeps clupeoides]XP_028813183.1 high choriolytic enzyme 1-like [Denticeps clupeoides]
MDHTAVVSVLVLLLSVSHALPLLNEWNNEEIQKDLGRPLDITTRILTANNGSSEWLIEGDLVVPRTRNALICLTNNCFWTKSTNGLVPVPYVLSSAFSSSDQQMIATAMNTFHTKTCIRFVPRTTQTDYLSIESKNGCYSSLGRQGGQQTVSLNTNGCIYNGVIQHELNHALGFYHEHTRSDRDQHVTINYANIVPGMAYNFDKQNTNNQNTPYDYSSVMHYAKDAFTIKYGLDTITPIPDSSVPIGQRVDLSSIDILRINKLYGCCE